MCMFNILGLLWDLEAMTWRKTFRFSCDREMFSIFATSYDEHRYVSAPE